MRASFVLIAVPLLAAGLRSQRGNLNHFQKYDLTIEFTSRGGNGGSAGHLSQGFAHGFIAGVETLTRASYTMQDQQAQTREPWDVGFAGLDAKGDPDYANARWYATNMMMPPGRGTRSFSVNHLGLQTSPFKIRQTRDQWHHVWHLKQQANWTTDGLSSHMSEAAPWQGTLLCGRTRSGHREIPRTDGMPAAQILEGFGWSNVSGNQRPAVQNRSWGLQLSFDEPVLNGAFANTTYNSPCPNPNWGYGSIDPDFNDIGSGTPPRLDDFRWLVNAGTAFGGGVAVLLWSNTVFPAGGLPTPFGQLHVNLADPLMAIGPIAMPPIPVWGSTELDLKLGPANSVFRRALTGFASLSTQAVVVSKNGRVRLTNLYTLRPRLQPPGFKVATAVKGQPFKVQKTPVQQTFFLRNDGRGVLVVQQLRGSQKVGPPVTVCERTAVRVALSIGANAVEVASPKTTPAGFAWAFNR